MLLIVPSRGRPENILRLYHGLKDTNSQLDFVVGLDNDDPKLEEYLALAEGRKIKFKVGPRVKFAGTVNAIVMENLDNYKYFAWCGDDHLPITVGWDQAYRDELDRLGTGVVYGDDLVMGKEIATELAFTSDIPKALGYAIPSGFVHLFVDNYFMELGESIGRLSYLPHIVVQHLHYSAGKSEEDQTYKEANSPENWSNDKIRFERYLNNELASDAEKLRKLL